MDPNKFRLKVCGMKYQENIKAVAELQPDYLGFIFYEKSPRNFDRDIPKLPESIKKVGVFVDASIDFVVKKVKEYDFKAVQLHGNESTEYCIKLNDRLNRPHRSSRPVRSNQVQVLDPTEPYVISSRVEIWKVFSIKDKFNFDRLQHYEGVVDYFLFDTKGKEKGGNGYTFDWKVLEEYPSTIPFILSGGIGLDEIDKVREILKTNLPIHAIDVNSKFEIEPGLKNIKPLKKFTLHLAGL